MNDRGEHFAPRCVFAGVRAAALLMVAVAACGGALETDPDPAPPTEEPEPASSASPSGLLAAVNEVRDGAASGPHCHDGMVSTPGGCERCAQDDQCPSGVCNPDTGRCSPQEWCDAEGPDPACASNEICEAGLCVLAQPHQGVCGVSDIHFAWDSSVLVPSAQRQLAAAAACFAKHDVAYIEAHADMVGTEEFNILLAEVRGNTVRKALVAAGVDEERLVVISKGSLEATGTTPETHAMDRRVTFVLP